MKLSLIPLLLIMISCSNSPQGFVEVVQTSRAGDKLLAVKPVDQSASFEFSLDEKLTYQTITGFGGAFTESSATLWKSMNPDIQDELIEAYFSEKGLNYSLTRTHMNSCDFSLDHYSYTPVENDTNLVHFSLEEDTADIIPMIQAAQAVSAQGFKIIASPWSAAPWMKDNNHWYGGKLKKEFYPTWALFFSKYIKGYSDYGIDIWGLTVENEPLGNDSHWESMHYTPHEMGDFVANHLGPHLQSEGLVPKVMIYDQNRGRELEEWAEVLLKDTAVTPYIYGTAVHWYNSTFSYFPETLESTHELAPDLHIIETEGCVDSEVPHWDDDDWYWQKEATDWGWDWASEEDKPMHPKYVPAFRYARDIIGCMNHWVEGWVDWNMILDDKGGPNLAQNWCVAPVLVKPETQEVYFTPLYYVMGHFSKYIRPGAQRIEIEAAEWPEGISGAAFKNPDGELVITLLNTTSDPIVYTMNHQGEAYTYALDASALQTAVIK